ncbi:unnamed protein product [Ixodes pacificus]
MPFNFGVLGHRDCAHRARLSGLSLSSICHRLSSHKCIGE